MPQCVGSAEKQIKPKWYDPMGPTSIDAKGHAMWAPTGGPQARGDIFNILAGLRTQFTNDAIKRFAPLGRAGARDTGWGDTADLARRTIRGDYLNGSPALDNALGEMRAAGQREAANAGANIRDQYSRNGMSFSTANQQAQQSAQAAATAKANETEAGARLANYLQERQNQTQAPGMLHSAYTAPIDILSSSEMGQLASLAQAAQIIAGLSGQGQIIKPDVLQQAGLGDQFMKAAGQVL